MRIRSIKPEFWRSDDIAALDPIDRLLFVGIWSYVDDNGVGLDKLAAITADLFAGDLERDAPETFARVSRGLQNLAEAGLIARYIVAGKPYLSVTGWDKHQRVDKPNKERFPRPDQALRETLATPSRESRETSAPGTGEQRNRGTEEQGGASAGPPVDNSRPAPFCDRHPNGSIRPCRACGDARRAHDTWTPTPVAKPGVKHMPGLCDAHRQPEGACEMCAREARDLEAYDEAESEHAAEVIRGRFGAA